MLEIKNLVVQIEDKRILNGVNLTVNKGEVAAIMGPNGSGKSTLSYVIAGKEDYEILDGEILLDGASTLSMDVVNLRRRVGMVFQKSNPFPKSIFDNVAYGLRINEHQGRGELQNSVEQSLRRAALWD